MSLIDVDKIEITVLVDNELDPITPSLHPEVTYAGLMRGLTLTPIPKNDHDHGHGTRGDAALELRMDSICCAAHGLSLLITATKGDTKHTLLFDAGPEGAVWERNVGRLQADVGGVEVIHLSHWHRDHSGGLEKAVAAVNAARSEDKKDRKVLVDVHPDRPDFRGVQFPGRAPISLEADPTFAELEAAGAVVEKHAEAHTVGEGFFWVSGEIPRATSYEGGIRGAVRYTMATGQWTSDPLIKDERLVACRLKGKGLVVFTGCSHAGVVNACRHAVASLPTKEAESGGESTGCAGLHAVVGGFHMADNDPTKMKATVDDLRALSPTVILPGHCTGWRFKYDYEQAVPGSLVPCFVGTKYVLDSVAQTA
jgi:7,8-dihydropterin-6-yl-methyl-4-(beta-D-ribofuranosyl)aminobenzene 5'-phosphate synthase